ncbi:hypothetical protein K6Q96_18665 [Grimontia kaedaensis]|uniref:Uncharacterized protein n=1 Tax=Grimontia kaedaensis TaxID=2872157 RepID=A0ABY4X217_9GAMM|nr:hypothetical protein [Grimontia kaedaensis]USH05240.1 hypothetical protein K6Q96_18665 [Grimontia kaedaensis]
MLALNYDSKALYKSTRHKFVLKGFGMADMARNAKCALVSCSLFLTSFAPSSLALELTQAQKEEFVNSTVMMLEAGGILGSIAKCSGKSEGELKQGYEEVLFQCYDEIKSFDDISVCLTEKVPKMTGLTAEQLDKCVPDDM